MPRNTQISVASNTRSVDFLKEQPRNTPYTLVVWGDFDGATLTVELSADDSTDADSMITAKDPHSGNAYAGTEPDVLSVPGGVAVYLSLSNVGAGVVYGKLV